MSEQTKKAIGFSKLAKPQQLRVSDVLAYGGRLIAREQKREIEYLPQQVVVCIWSTKTTTAPLSQKPDVVKKIYFLGI